MGWKEGFAPFMPIEKGQEQTRLTPQTFGAYSCAARLFSARDVFHADERVKCSYDVIIGNIIEETLRMSVDIGRADNYPFGSSQGSMDWCTRLLVDRKLVRPSHYQ